MSAGDDFVKGFEDLPGQLLDAEAARKPCAVCVLNAVRRGVPFEPDDDPSTMVGQKINDGTEVHRAVTTIGGTDVCVYHVDTVAVTMRL